MLETPIGWGLLFLVGIFTGTLSGLLGIGGGLLMVPVLTFFGIPLVEATATSLIGVLFKLNFWNCSKLSDQKLELAGVTVTSSVWHSTAQLGAWLGDRLPDAGLSLAFAALLLITIYMMQLRQKLKRQENKHQEAADNIPDSSDAAQAEITAKTFKPIAGIGLLAGILSGLFGVGGGIVMVPLQMLFLGEGIKAAVRTSLGAIVTIAISGLAQHAWNGNVLWAPGLCLGLGGIGGAQVGTRLLPKLPDRIVNLLFRSFLIALSIYMTARAFRV